jgi:hypothetical protein
MTVVNPFDFQRIFMNILAGSPEIFIFIIFIAIVTGAAFFKMDDRLMLVLILIFGLVMSTFTSFGGLYILIILVVGIITFYSIARMFNR